MKTYRFSATSSTLLLIGLLSCALLFSSFKKSSKSIVVDKQNEIMTAILTGDIWFDIDDNFILNGEPGISGVAISLINADNGIVIDNSVSNNNGSYIFTDVGAGKYLISILPSNFDVGGPLFSSNSCLGTSDANNGIDNDDNGSDTAPSDVRSSIFTVSEADALNSATIDHIDFCFAFSCSETNMFATDNCSADDDDIICDMSIFDAFCNVMPSGNSNGTQPNPLCNEDDPDGVDNISWWSFMAYEGDYSIAIIPTNCTNAPGTILNGIQVGVYEDCSFTNQLFCMSDCSTSPVSIPSSSLKQGAVNYLFLDGCFGSVCNYDFEIVGNFSVPDIEPSSVCIQNNGVSVCDTSEFCVGRDVVFEVDGVNKNSNVSWKVTTVSGGPYVGAGNILTEENEVSISFAQSGVYEVCIDQVSNACSIWADSVLCHIVEISSEVVVLDNEMFPTQNICTEAMDMFDLSIIDNLDPNGDGVSGWQGIETQLAPGSYNITVPVENCSYDQSIEITSLPDSEKGNYFLIGCDDELPIEIAGMTISSADFGDDLVLNFSDVIIPGGDVNGCDSLADITIERVLIADGVLALGDCVDNGIILDFSFDAQASTVPDMVTIQFTDPNGMVLEDNYEPFDPSNILLQQGIPSGVYVVTVSYTKGDVTCTNAYSLNVSTLGIFPQTPSFSGPSVTCEDNKTVYVASSGTSQDFIWSFPADAEGTLSGSQNSILTVDWSGSNGGIVSLRTENPCGSSELVELNVDVIDPGTPDFSISETNACVNSLVNINYTGTNAQNYEWDFGDAFIINGTGSGPYQVRYTNPGEKSIALFLTTNEGCVSDTITKSLSVSEPLEDINIICDPFLNEVIFSWQGIDGVDFFEVDVSTGQTGVLQGTQYTVSGISPGEAVSITVRGITINQACGEFIESQITCVAQDCPILDVTIQASETTICLNENTSDVQLAAMIESDPNGTGVFSGNGIISSDGVFRPSEAQLGENTISYRFDTDGGCVYFGTIDILVNESPTADFSFVNDEICISDNAIIQYTGTQDVDVYQWTFDGGNGNQVPNPTVSFSTSGDKEISLQVIKNDCPSETVTNTISVQEELSDFILECVPGEGNIMVSWQNVDGAEYYEVSINGNPPTQTTTFSFILDELDSEQDISIEVVAVSDGICPNVTSTLTCTSLFTSIEEDNIDNVRLFPNPSSNSINIEGLQGTWSYKIYSIHGEEVLRGSSQSRIDISRLGTGLHYVYIETKDKTFYRPFLKVE